MARTSFFANQPTEFFGPAGFTPGPQELIYSRKVSETLNGGTISVDGSGYLTFTVPGGVATTYPGNGVYAAWRVQDPTGDPAFAGSIGWLNSTKAQLLEQGTPDTSGDSYLYFGFSNNPDLTTARGTYWGIQYTGASRAVCSGNMNGAGGGGLTVAAANNAIRGIYGTAAQYLSGQNVGIYGTACDGVDWSTLVGGASILFGGGLWEPNVPIYAFVAAGRLAATAGTVTLKCQAAYVPTAGIESAF